MRKNAFWLLLLPVFFMACEKQPNLPEPAQFPEIVRIFLPERAFLADTTGILVHARIFDPQGPADLSEVTCRIQRPDGSEADFAMRDDGLEGDILAGDGQFAVRIPGAAWSDTGRGEVRVFAVDRSGNRAESEPRSIAIVPGKSGAAPVIQRVTFPDTVWADINYQIPLLVQADDPDGLADIAEIQYAVYAPGRATTSIQGQLLDDGNNDDGVAGNGTYGAIFASDAFGVERGVYSIVLRAIDKEGNRSPGRVVIFCGANEAAKPSARDRQHLRTGYGVAFANRAVRDHLHRDRSERARRYRARVFQQLLPGRHAIQRQSVSHARRRQKRSKWAGRCRGRRRRVFSDHWHRQHQHSRHIPV
ncbi:MAG: hypothetical protein Q9P14_09175 [candidate division KSB1 bacterium]|nr:hypothetical protein [candidate division KSB1 bacterium]